MSKACNFSSLSIIALFGAVSCFPLSGQGFYADFDFGVGSMTSGTGTFGPASGVPDFNFQIADPNGDFILSGLPGGERIDDPAWQSVFGPPSAGAENLFVQIGGPSGGIPASVSINFDFSSAGGTPAGVALGIAVVDLEVEDAIFSAVDASGMAVADSVIAGWFQNVFDGNTSAGNTNFAQWDPANLALVAQADADGVLDNNVVSDISTESASGWLFPNIPLNSLTIEYRNRTDRTTGFPIPGASNAHFFVAAVPIPEPSHTLLLGLTSICALLSRRRSR